MRKTYPAYIMWFFDACACIGWWLFLFGARKTDTDFFSGGLIGKDFQGKAFKDCGMEVVEQCPPRSN